MTSSRYLYITNIFFRAISFRDQLLHQVLRVVDGVDNTIVIPIFLLIFRSAFKKETQSRIIATRRNLPVHDPVDILIIAGIGLVLCPPPKAAGEKSRPGKLLRVMP